MKIQSDQKLFALDGVTPLEGQDGEKVTLGDMLANIVVGHSGDDKMKLFTLAQRLYKEKEVEVDASDLALMKEACKESKTYTNLITGQILMILEGVK